MQPIETPRFLSPDEYAGSQGNGRAELSIDEIRRLSTPARDIVDYFTYLRGNNPLFLRNENQWRAQFGAQLDESFGGPQHPLVLLLGKTGIKRGHVNGGLVFLDFYNNHPSHFTDEPHPDFPQPFMGLRKLGTIQAFHSMGKSVTDTEFYLEKALNPSIYEHELFLKLAHEFFEMHGHNYQSKKRERDARIQKNRTEKRAKEKDGIEE